MFANLFQIFLALASLSGLILTVVAVRRYRMVGLVMISVVILSAWEDPFSAPLINQFGLSVYLNDLIAVILFGVAVMDWNRMRWNLRTLEIFWLGFGALVLLSVVRGAIVFNLGTSVNEARSAWLLFCCMSWTLSQDWRDARMVEQFCQFSLILGWLLALVAAVHAVQYGIGDASSTIEKGGQTSTGRILNSGQAMVLVLCTGVVLVGDSSRNRKLMFSSATAFAMVIALSQNRSTWAAALSGVLATVILSRRDPAGRQRSVLFAIVLGTLAAVVWFVGVGGGLVSDLARSGADTRTFDARETSWNQLVSEAISKGPETVLIGEPFGSGFARLEPNGLVTDYSPHNWYVYLFLRIGLLGLCTWVMVILGSLVRARASKGPGVFVLAATAVFSWFYSVEWYMGLWLGMAIIEGDLKSLESSRRDAPSLWR